jgi:hypothetical protein
MELTLLENEGIGLRSRGQSDNARLLVFGRGGVPPGNGENWRSALLGNGTAPRCGRLLIGKLCVYHHARPRLSATARAAIIAHIFFCRPETSKTHA